MLEAVRSKKKVLLVITATFSLFIVLGFFVLSFTFIPDVSRSARSMPILQEVRLFLYRLGNPSQTAVRHGGVRGTEIILHDPMGIAEDRVGNIFVADRGRWFGLAAIWKISHNGRTRLVAGTGHRRA